MSDRVYSKTYPPMDDELQLHDGAAAVTADGAGQVDSAAAVIDLGDDDFGATGEGSYAKGDMVVIPSAMDFTTGDEKYDLKIQLSTKADFADTIVDRAVLPLGDARQGADVNVTGLKRYTLGFDNEMGGVRYRYARLYFDVSGTTPSITCKAWLTKDVG